MNKTICQTVRVILSLAVMVFLPMQQLWAQCAMCTLNAENSVRNGNTQGMGLNDGILFLLAMPYLIAIAIGILWYKKYRRKNQTQIQPKHDSIHLN